MNNPIYPITILPNNQILINPNNTNKSFMLPEPINVVDQDNNKYILFGAISNLFLLSTKHNKATWKTKNISLFLPNTLDNQISVF